MTFEEIFKQLNEKIYRPIYFLMGEEPYFIDRITEHIAEHMLTEEEKTFNQMILYGKDTDITTVINTARRFPMMASHQVVIVREAQNLERIEDLIHYVENPLESTLLVINYKYKKLDKRKKLFKALEKNSILFDSKRLYDEKIPPWINSYLRSRGKKIEPKAAVILTEYLGNDLGKIANELDKLIIVLKAEQDIIGTAECIKSQQDSPVFWFQSKKPPYHPDHNIHLSVFQQGLEVSFPDRQILTQCCIGTWDPTIFHP
jgi:DNA polymerase-3 subunit delta